jgi:hypothetical protein
MKRLIITLLLAISAMPSFADKAWVTNATIQRSLVEQGKFGGCMMQLDKSVKDTGLNCPAANWVSFDCDGLYGSTLTSLRIYDTALMAFALEKTVNVRVDDTKFHDGYCVATRIDLQK